MVFIDLQWLTFSVNLSTVKAWMQANAGPSYDGMAADNDLTLVFTAEPGDDVRAAISAYWAGLTTNSAEATSYQSQAQANTAAQSAQAANLASATAKLKALGLTDAEIAALQE